MEDGALKSNYKAYYLCTDCFSLSEVKLLAEVFLEKYNISVSFHKKGNTQRIYIPRSEYQKFKELIFPYIHTSMYYKLPQVEKHLITTKVNKYLDILNKISMMKDSLKKIENYNKVIKKIKKQRGEATQKEGEFSVNNLVFKVLRNKKVFDIIKGEKKEIVNKVFSLNLD
jgi:DNA-directed RNA polymerase subunit H (RpoH/RPB5)